MLSIVMLVYNANDIISRLTRETVQSVAKNTVGDYELILFKNGGEVMDWTIYDEGVTGIQLSTDRGERLGLATAYNMAVAKTRGDYICVLHNDVVLPPGWNVPLMESAKNGHLAFPMVDESASDCLARGIPKTEPFQTTGSCFVMSRDSWNKVGGYDEDFLGYHWEDSDLFIRAGKAGLKFRRCDVTIVHYRGATRTFTKPEENDNFYTNMEHYIGKHGTKMMVLSETPQEV